MLVRGVWIYSARGVQIYIIGGIPIYYTSESLEQAYVHRHAMMTEQHFMAAV